uniref:Ig-like domain-containing protein n=1 Tax=Graphocephala atropunctata TaxID=36148 RepID=A0A1B6MU49_9HEMI
MLVLLVVMTLFRQLSCETKPGHDDAHIESLLQMLFYESTFSPPPAATTTQRTLPYFVTSSTATNLTTQLGNSVTFHCRVNDLVDEASVSWLRRRDGQLHLLSVGVEVYSTDGRFTAAFAAPNDWQLRLTTTQDRDQGYYECQVSSHPPIVFTVHLQVVVPELEIADERGLPIKNKFYNAGSTIELKCIISRIPEPSNLITWTHGTRVLNFDTSRGGISVKTDSTAGGAMSRLFIANARTVDSGNYSCILADLASSTVTVHVLNGETPAAMQHGASTTPLPSLFLCVLQLLLSTR